MKLNQTALGLAALVLQTSSVGAVRCGKWFSNACLAESDTRYDDTVSNHFADQAPIWSRLHGYYKATAINYMVNGLPADQPTHFFQAFGTGFPYEVFPSIQYVNISTVGSRYREHRIGVNPPANQAFCNETVPPGALNVLDLEDTGAVCGVNGFIFYSEGFSTTSQEKDGRALQLPLNLPTTTPENVDFTSDQQDGSFPSASGNAIFTSNTGDPLVSIFDTLTCLDDNCDQITRSTENYFKVENMTIFGGSTRLTMTRVPTEDEWVNELKEVYEANGILTPITVPFTHECLGSQNSDGLWGRCPTEEEWCTIDPECATPLYVEPNGTVDAGVIAGFTVAGFVIIIGLLYVWHLRAMSKQAERNRVKFARRIAETIKLEGSTRQLTPDSLAAEFKLRSAADGTISKDDLWNFLASGQAGAMSQADFDALFAAIDLDDSGAVDFLEFCTYMGHCNEEFEHVKGRQSVLRARPSFAVQSQRRSSVAESTARKLASMRDVTRQAVVDEEGEEEDEEVHEEAAV